MYISICKILTRQKNISVQTHLTSECFSTHYLKAVFPGFLTVNKNDDIWWPTLLLQLPVLSVFLLKISFILAVEKFSFEDAAGTAETQAM